MANWAQLHFQARLHAAHEPGFLATRHLELVALNGGHLGFCLNLGLDLATPEGRDAASFQAALIMFCWELCQMGVGHLPYQPAPNNHGPLGPIAVAAPQLPPAHHAQAPQVDNDFVEIVGGVHPIHGPWVVDHDFVEIIGGFDPIHGPWVEGPGEAVADPGEQFPNVGLNDLPNLDLDFGADPGDDIDLNVDFDFDLDLLQ
jgi:hypothetical protein